MPTFSKLLGWVRLVTFPSEKKGYIDICQRVRFSTPTDRPIETDALSVHNKTHLQKASSESNSGIPNGVMVGGYTLSG